MVWKRLGKVYDGKGIQHRPHEKGYSVIPLVNKRAYHYWSGTGHFCHSAGRDAINAAAPKSSVMSFNKTRFSQSRSPISFVSPSVPFLTDTFPVDVSENVLNPLSHSRTNECALRTQPTHTPNVKKTPEASVEREQEMGVCLSLSHKHSALYACASKPPALDLIFSLVHGERLFMLTTRGRQRERTFF